MTKIFLNKLYRVKPATESQIRIMGFNPGNYPVGKVVRVTHNYAHNSWHEIQEVDSYKDWGIDGYYLGEYCMWMKP